MIAEKFQEILGISLKNEDMERVLAWQRITLEHRSYLLNSMLKHLMGRGCTPDQVAQLRDYFMRIGEDTPKPKLDPEPKLEPKPDNSRWLAFFNIKKLLN